MAAARLEKSIETELLNRLRSKAYGDAPLNVNEDVWRQVLDMDRRREKAENGEALLEGEEELEMEDDISQYESDSEDDEELGVGQREYLSGSDEGESDVDDMEDYGSEVRSTSSGAIAPYADIRRSSGQTMVRRMDRTSRRISRSQTRRRRAATRAARCRRGAKGQGAREGQWQACAGSRLQAESAPEGREEGRQEAWVCPRNCALSSAACWTRPGSRLPPAGPTVNVEYEMETEPLTREMLKNW